MDFLSRPETGAAGEHTAAQRGVPSMATINSHGYLTNVYGTQNGWAPQGDTLHPARCIELTDVAANITLVADNFINTFMIFTGAPGAGVTMALPNAGLVRAAFGLGLLNQIRVVAEPVTTAAVAVGNGSMTSGFFFSVTNGFSTANTLTVAVSADATTAPKGTAGLFVLAQTTSALFYAEFTSATQIIVRRIG